jgi:hypothetical protein
VVKNNLQNLARKMYDKNILLKKYTNKNSLNSVSVREVHGYVTQKFRPVPIVGEKLRDLRSGLVFGIYIFFRLETLQRFRRLRKVDMYRRRTQETRERAFLIGTLLRWTGSERDNEKNISILYMDKWFNRLQFNFRSSAVNFLGIAQWDLRSFFRSYKFFLGRKNAHGKWLSESLKKRPGRWLL